MEFSRPAGVAANLGIDAPDSHLFLNKRVLLTGESQILKTENGHHCFWSSLLLLIRMGKFVDIYLPPDCDKLKMVICADLEILNYPISPQFLDKTPDMSNYDAILNIGKSARKDLPWTVINCNGWVLRLSSGKDSISDICDQTNPISALAVACLGATEVFKRLIRLREERGSLINKLSFSLYSYQNTENDCGPLLPDIIQDDILVVGAGAIGNGLVYLLSLLPLKGRVLIVDPQRFQPENFGTCLLIGQNAIGKEKAMIMSEYLKGRGILTKDYPEKIEEFINRVGKEIPSPQIVINGLDNIDARHATQDLWPDIVIDGAISDLVCQISRHPWDDDIACLKCLFRKNNMENADEIASKATGLDLQRVKDAFEFVSDNDVVSAPENKKEFLRKNIGKQICSVIQDGVAQELSKEQQSAGFAPSVPFVACFSASMAISELIKVVTGASSNLEPRFQFDILRGLSLGEFVSQRRRKDCICVARRKNIELMRKNRLNKINK